MWSVHTCVDDVKRNENVRHKTKRLLCVKSTENFRRTPTTTLGKLPPRVILTVLYKGRSKLSVSL